MICNNQKVRGGKVFHFGLKEADYIMEIMISDSFLILTKTANQVQGNGLMTANKNEYDLLTKNCKVVMFDTIKLQIVDDKNNSQHESTVLGETQITIYWVIQVFILSLLAISEDFESWSEDQCFFILSIFVNFCFINSNTQSTIEQMLKIFLFPKWAHSVDVSNPRAYLFP